MSARIGGRPSSYKASIASAICTQLREGEYLKSICQQEGMPSLNTVYRWRQEIGVTTRFVRNLYAKRDWCGAGQRSVTQLAR